MKGSIEINPVVSKNNITYSVVCDNHKDTLRNFGIFAVMNDDETDSALVENLFFTEAEATEYCNWLAQNQVFPITLREVLENIFNI